MARKPRKAKALKCLRNCSERDRSQPLEGDAPTPAVESGLAPDDAPDGGEAAGAMPTEAAGNAEASDAPVVFGTNLAESVEEPGEAHPGAGALVPFDPLSRYLAEIRQFPLLTREEEMNIAKRYRKHRDPADAYRLVTANLRLVVKIAMEFTRASRNLLDLIQEGNVGLMDAVRKFDPYRGIRFPSYAVWWIRAYLYRYLINNWRLVKIGTTQAQRKLFFNLKRETERLEAEGFAPEPRLLAQRMGVKETAVREMQERMAHSELSLDQPAAGAEDTRLLDLVPDVSHNPEETAAGGQWRAFAKEKVGQFLGTLKGKELEIFKSRLLAEEPATLQEIGERFGISRERVRQIESRLKKQFGEFVKSQAGDIEPAGP